MKGKAQCKGHLSGVKEHFSWAPLTGGETKSMTGKPTRSCPLFLFINES